MTALTLQQVFNGAWERAKHKVRCTSYDGISCRYRAEGTPPCFIGVSIPDELYDIHFEGRNAGDIAVNELPELFADIEPETLCRLQRIHDKEPPAFWEGELRAFAKELNLEVPA